MTRKSAVRALLLAVAALLLGAHPALAHRIDEYLQATLLSLDAQRVEGSMRLIPGIVVAPAVIAGIDTDGDGAFSEAEQKAYALRVLGDQSLTEGGHPAPLQLVSWSFPDPGQLRAGLGEIHIEYTAAVPDTGPHRSLTLANHHLPAASVYLVNTVVPDDGRLRILGQRRNPQQSLYQLDYEQAGGPPSRWAALRTGLDGIPFLNLFELGLRHIAEGTDHLLFLLALLLPAPLLAAGSRWAAPAGVRRSLLRITGIVTAFTLGHSVTLSLAALGAVHVPGRPVEALIAASILVSALHALRPIFPGREAWVAAFFGLIHGLAFAATLSRLDLGRWQRVGGILAFNLGIETMQILVVAAVLPSLLLLSRTRAYALLRVAGAIFAGVAALGWTLERTLGLETQVDTVVNLLARHAVWFAAALFAFSVACRYLPAARPAPQAAPSS